MTLLIAGVLLWTIFHLLKRVSPATRTSLDAKLGEGPAKGIIALIFLASIIMMIFGYIHVGEGQAVYEVPDTGTNLSILLMLLSVFFLGAGSGKGKAPTLVRHPMLTGVVLWSAAHLVISGDLRTVILFGGMAVWAILNILAINFREGEWDKPKAGPISGDIKTVIISLVIFAIIAAIHHLIGPSPLGE